MNELMNWRVSKNYTDKYQLTSVALYEIDYLTFI